MSQRNSLSTPQIKAIWARYCAYRDLGDIAEMEYPREEIHAAIVSRSEHLGTTQITDDFSEKAWLGMWKYYDEKFAKIHKYLILSGLGMGAVPSEIWHIYKRNSFGFDLDGLNRWWNHFIYTVFQGGTGDQFHSAGREKITAACFAIAIICLITYLSKKKNITKEWDKDIAEINHVFLLHEQIRVQDEEAKSNISNQPNVEFHEDEEFHNLASPSGGFRVPSQDN